jgi:hypothetical protein
LEQPKILVSILKEIIANIPLDISTHSNKWVKLANSWWDISLGIKAAVWGSYLDFSFE